MTHDTTDTNADVLNQLITILSDVGGVNRDDITAESRLTEDLGISSLNMIESIIHIEDTFGVRIEDSEAKDFSHVGDVVDFITTRRTDVAKSETK